VRFRNPHEGRVVVEDLIHGPIVVQNAELDDLIIARADGSPTYNLTVVVDDLDMRISHVIRGDDHINNTPRQMNIMRALGAEPPRYGHVPMILGPDGAKLSKRHGAVSVLQYRDDGFLPEALINYLVRLGWSHGDQEVFGLEEMIEYFDIADVNKAASAVNPDKLLWLNQHYLKNSAPEHVVRHLAWHFGQLGIDPSEGPAPHRVVEAQRERAKTLSEMAQASRYFYLEFEDYDEKAARKHLGPDAAPVLERLAAELQALPQWTAEAIHGVLEAVGAALELKLGKVAQPLRVAVTGGAVSPPIDQTLELLGREVTLARIDRALARG
jgi:glutamyl-tRNA synthetase